MNNPVRPAGTIDEYIAGFPDEVRNILEKIRSTIKNAVPDAEEAFKYGLPTFVLGGNLAHFGGFKKHVGFYPSPSAIEAFHSELSGYATAKGTVQLPLDTPIPYDLISRMVLFRAAELRKQRAKKTGKVKK